MAANRQSGVSVIVVHGHVWGSFTEVESRSQANSALAFLSSQQPHWHHWSNLYRRKQYAQRAIRPVTAVARCCPSDRAVF